MIVPNRVSHRPRRSGRFDQPEQHWVPFLAGTGAFLLVAAFCLFLVANLAP